MYTQHSEVVVSCRKKHGIRNIFLGVFRSLMGPRSLILILPLADQGPGIVYFAASHGCANSSAALLKR